MPGMKKLDPKVLRETLTKGLALPADVRRALTDSLAPATMVRTASHEKRGMASVSRLDGLAVPGGTGGIWTVPLFERFPHLLDTLGVGVRTKMAVVMIDLSGFSSGTANLDPDQIRTLLDPFYEMAVAKIEAAGGVVEKFIGDAIIALFGHPFRSDANQDPFTYKSDLRNAVNVAKHCICWTHNHYKGEMTAKAATTYGELFVGWVGPETYSDLTVIGRPLTELFRLEAIAPDRGIIMPKWYFDHNIAEALNWVGPGEYAAWHHSNERDVALRGLGALDVHKIVYNLSSG
jgi:class 3 adenylate cyclase